MSTAPLAKTKTRTLQSTTLAGWSLVIGGVLFFLGGFLHPHEDPPDATLKEHMRVMFDDPAWYPAHAALVIGTSLIAVALVALVRGGTLRSAPHVHTAAVVAAVAACLTAPAMLIHLVAATEADKIASHQSTPIIDTQVVAETITSPLFGLSIAALGVIGAATRTLGNWLAAAFAVVGGVAYALAGGTFLLTEALDLLFPLAGAIALWAIITGIGLLRQEPAAAPPASA